jgi:hypothetical protein
MGPSPSPGRNPRGDSARRDGQRASAKGPKPCQNRTFCEEPRASCWTCAGTIAADALRTPVELGNSRSVRQRSSSRRSSHWNATRSASKPNTARVTYRTAAAHDRSRVASPSRPDTKASSASRLGEEGPRDPESNDPIGLARRVLDVSTGRANVRPEAQALLAPGDPEFGVGIVR